MKVKIISDGEWDLGHTLNHVSVYSTDVYSWVFLLLLRFFASLLLVADPSRFDVLSIYRWRQHKCNHGVLSCI